MSLIRGILTQTRSPVRDAEIMHIHIVQNVNMKAHKTAIYSTRVTTFSPLTFLREKGVFIYFKGVALALNNSVMTFFMCFLKHV